MQKEYTENWNKLYQCVSKPMADMAELNINTLNNWTKNSNLFDDLAQSKRPEEILSAQMKMANVACQEMTKYTQRALDIGMNAMSEAGKIWTDLLRQSTDKASEFVKQTHGYAGHKDKEKHKD